MGSAEVQIRNGIFELPLVTSGDEINKVKPLIKDFAYSAKMF